MLTIASRLLREAPGGEKPTVLMLVDRNELEDQLTVFRDTSEVSRLNRLAAHAPVPVEEHLFRLLRHEQAEDPDAAIEISYALSGERRSAVTQSANERRNDQGRMPSAS